MLPSFQTLLLGAWVVVTIALFWRLDGRRAALIAMIGGWAFLPTGDYPESVIRAGMETTAPTHALAIPAPPWFNKASAIGLGCLCGVVLFNWSSLRRVRVRWFDLPMIVWILVPIASAIDNGFPLSVGLAQSRHLVLAWGVPYAIGRAMFADTSSLRSFARAWTLAGLAYLPLGLAEFAIGPFWYHLVYGGHPYRFSGYERLVGHRPVVFLEDGNQLGTWAATAAVAAAWLWALGDSPTWGWRRLRIPGAVVAASLVAACLLWQSHGSVALMTLALTPLLARRLRTGKSRLIFVGTLVVAAVLAAAVAGGVKGGAVGPRNQIRSLFLGLGKRSFTWRLGRIEDHLPQLAKRPLLGWGKADWSQYTPNGTFVDPIALNLSFLADGMYGAVGLLSSAGLLFLPIAAAIVRLRPLGWDMAPWLYFSLATALLAVNVADLAVNSSLLLPVLIAAGGLATWSLDRPPGKLR